MRHIVLVGIAAVWLAAVASASAGWTPKQTATLLTSRATVFYGVRGIGGRVVSGAETRSASTASCVGAGTQTGGVFSAFSCALTWPSPNDPSTTVRDSVFVRPWSARAVCISNVSVGACPPAPPAKTLPNDPRKCGGSDFAQCVLNAANSAAQTAGKNAGKSAVPGTCKATTSWTVYLCAGATVHFVSASSGWTVTTTLNA